MWQTLSRHLAQAGDVIGEWRAEIVASAIVGEMTVEREQLVDGEAIIGGEARPATVAVTVVSKPVRVPRSTRYSPPDKHQTRG